MVAEVRSGGFVTMGIFAANQQGIDGSLSLNQFQGRCPLAGDHIFMIVGRYHGEPVLDLEPPGDFLAASCLWIVINHRSPIRFSCCPLNDRRIDRHDHGRRHAQKLAHQRHGLGMVAG